MSARADVEAREERLVLALTHVTGATAACAAHGDAPTVEVLAAYYALVGEAAAAAGGRVVKVIGDGAVLTFPVERAREAVGALRALQPRATSLWQTFDERCRLEVKVGAGPVVSAALGPPGAERPDVYGNALNQLFKAPWAPFVVMPDVEPLLQ